MVPFKGIHSCKRISISIILIVLTLLLSACQDKEQQKSKMPAKNEKSKSPLTAKENEWKLPVPILEGQFYKVAGWLSDTEILYITNLEQTSNVYRYHLLSGKSELVYKTGHPIVNVQVSPSKKNILIHSSPSSYEGLVTIIDTNGTEKLKETYASYELVFEWNPYNEAEILVSKFEEDWTFQTFILDVRNAKTTELSVPQPFIKWTDEQDIAFINWDENDPALFAPLIMKNLRDGKEETVFSEAIHFSAFHQLLMTVSLDEQDPSMASYSFFDKQLSNQFSFSIPQLTKFSDWLIPFYDYNEKKDQFFTFSPLASGDIDSYTDGFKLVSFSLKKGSFPKVVMEGLENEPISFSPTGEALLYGNRFEKLIDMKTKKIVELIKE